MFCTTALPDDGPVRAETCSSFIKLITVTLKCVHSVGIIYNNCITTHGVKNVKTQFFCWPCFKMGFVLCSCMCYMLFDDVGETEHCICLTSLSEIIGTKRLCSECGISNYGCDACFQTNALLSFPQSMRAFEWYCTNDRLRSFHFQLVFHLLSYLPALYSLKY